LLNKSGFKTTSSCAGHAPGAQYEHVKDWMEPYITFAGRPHQLIESLTDAGFVAKVTVNSDKTAITLRRDIEWGELFRHLGSIVKGSIR
jgi:hypothetical protein